MKKIISTVAILFCIEMVHAQGIKFEHGLTWEQVEAKAKMENKFIFMDCYATWCGPCKFMTDSIFSEKEVGDYMNEHFISVAVQVDQTSKDADDIRNWYDETKSIIKQYSIDELPTYLYFAPDGHPVDRVIGMTGKRGLEFIARTKDALDPDKQYYTLVENYKTNLYDSALLRRLLILCLNLNDNRNVEEIANAYTNCLKDHYSIDNLILLYRAMRSSNDKSFVAILNNTFRIDSALHDEGYAERGVCDIVARQDILPYFSKRNSPVLWDKVVKVLRYKYPALSVKTIQLLFGIFENEILAKEIRLPLYKKDAVIADWGKVSDRIKKHYLGYNPDMMIAREKARYYAYKKMWPQCERSVISYMNKYGRRLNNSELNSISWEYVFMHSSNRDLLSKALEWSRRTIPDPQDTEAYTYSGTYENIDTYANLLYKLGYREKAIFWEKKALDLANRFPPDPIQISFQITLTRMQRGQKTWVGRDERYEEYQY
jgi:thioredoxin-related protein